MEVGALVKDRKTAFGVFAAPPLGGSFSIFVAFFLSLAQ